MRLCSFCNLVTPSSSLTDIFSRNFPKSFALLVPALPKDPFSIRVGTRFFQSATSSFVNSPDKDRSTKSSNGFLLAPVGVVIMSTKPASCALAVNMRDIMPQNINFAVTSGVTFPLS